MHFIGGKIHGLILVGYIYIISTGNLFCIFGECTFTANNRYSVVLTCDSEHSESAVDQTESSRPFALTKADNICASIVRG